MEPVEIPQCADCGTEWDAAGRCVRCGMEREEQRTLLAAAHAAYLAAYRAAKEGRFRDALTALTQGRRLGLRDPAAERLQTLCAAVLGEWQAIHPDSLPEAWRSAAQETAVRESYAAAVRAARQGDWQETLTVLEPCLASAEWLLPAQKLRLFALTELGRISDAEALRQKLLTELPHEPEVLRYRLPEPSPSEAPLSGRPAPERSWLPVWASAGLAAACLATGIVLGSARSASPPVSAAVSLRPPVPPPTEKAPSAVPPVASAPQVSSSTASVLPPKASALPSAMRREWESRQAEQQERQARRWFNQAVRAGQKKAWTRAGQLADAAYAIAPQSYLADEALLLCARAAERGGKKEADALYARLADEKPASPYAPFCLSQAARLAEGAGNPSQAQQYRARLRQNYPRSRYALRPLPPLREGELPGLHEGTP